MQSNSETAPKEEKGNETYLKQEESRRKLVAIEQSKVIRMKAELAESIMSRTHMMWRRRQEKLEENANAPNAGPKPA